MTAIIILVCLFGALAIVIPMLEKSNTRISTETQAKFSRYIWPLIGVLLIVQLFMLAF